MSIFCRQVGLPAPPAPKGEGTEPSSKRLHRMWGDY